VLCTSRYGISNTSVGFGRSFTSRIHFYTAEPDYEPPSMAREKRNLHITQIRRFPILNTQALNTADGCRTHAMCSNTSIWTYPMDIGPAISSHYVITPLLTRSGKSYNGHRRLPICVGALGPMMFGADAIRYWMCS
jgi:hypothetical protein